MDLTFLSGVVRNRKMASALKQSLSVDEGDYDDEEHGDGGINLGNG